MLRVEANVGFSFFFQAEDGIRDWSVTGVQTCALPILRPDDIPALVEHFIRAHNLELKKHFKGADGSTLKILMSLPWKGNIRELRSEERRVGKEGRCRGERSGAKEGGHERGSSGPAR